MSGLTKAVRWTQRVGYSYPTSNFQAALKATFPRLTETEVVHCVYEHEKCVNEWNQRLWGHDAHDFSPEASGRV